MDITKLDPQSRWEMRLIEVETAIEKLNKKPSDPKIGESEARIKVLEDARQRQISFNTEVSNRLAKLEKPAEKLPEKPAPQIAKVNKFKWWK